MKINGLANPLPDLDKLNDAFCLCDFDSGLMWRKRHGRIVAGTRAGYLYTQIYCGKKYWITCLDWKQYPVHRIVWAIANNSIPPVDMEIDHVNGNGLDNSPANLRLVTRGQNCRNLQRGRKDSKTGILGVCWNKKDKKWVAQIGVNRKMLFLGNFNAIEDAVAARKAAELEYWGKS